MDTKVRSVLFTNSRCNLEFAAIIFTLIFCHFSLGPVHDIYYLKKEKDIMGQMGNKTCH